MMKVLSAGVAAACALSACGNSLKFKDVPQGNQSVKSLEEAGSVHVSVVSVMPWANVKEKLKPKLAVDEQTARAQAVPVTFSMLDRYLDILRLRASIAPNTARTTETSTFTSETGAEDKESTSRSTTRAPGTLRDTTVPDPLLAGSKPGDLSASATAINSSLSARAVASYIQEIQALNAEVDHAAQRTGFTPYLLRVQVSVMPLRRHLGYDVYSNLSFFAYQETSAGGNVTRTPTSFTPFVVPLLSSDSIETAQRSRSIEAIRDIGIALDLIKGFGSVGVGFGSQTDRQQALAGADVNSVMTMGRLSDNSLRVRFGAAYDPGGGYSTHPRTNTISVLVYLPDTASRMRVVSRQSWIHTLDGTILERNGSTYDDRVDRIANQFPELGLTSKTLLELDEYTLTGNYKEFNAGLRKAHTSMCTSLSGKPEFKDLHANYCASTNHTRHELEWERKTAYVWSNLLALLPGGRFSTNVVDLPTLKAVCPTGMQLATYQEEEGGISVNLTGAKDLSKEKMSAVLHLGQAPQAAAPAARSAASAAVRGRRQATADVTKDATKPQTPPAPPTQYLGALMASNIEVAASRQSAKLVFTTKGLEAMPWATAGSLQPVAVEVSGCAPMKAQALPATFSVKAAFDLSESQAYMLGARALKREKPQDKTSVTLSAPGSTVLAKEGSGVIDVVVEVAEDDKNAYVIGVSGANLRDVGPAASVQARGDGTWLIKQPGALRLTLANLVENQSVDVEVRQVENNKVGAALRKQPVLVRTVAKR